MKVFEKRNKSTNYDPLKTNKQTKYKQNKNKKLYPSDSNVG